MRAATITCLAIGFGVTTFLACGGGDDSAAPGNGNDGGAVEGGGSSDGSTGADGAATVIDVHGTLKSELFDHPLLTSRDVVVIDAAGNVTKTSTGADGTFSATGIATPYDIAVPYVVADAASFSEQQYYAGITRPDPVVFGRDYANPPAKTARSSDVTVTLTACSGCFIWFSNSGGASYDHADVGTGAAKAYTTTCGWAGDATLTSAFHFYIANSGPGSFVGHADVAATILSDGLPTSLGTPPIQALSGGGSLTVSAALPAGYGTPQLIIGAYHPDGSRVANYPLVNDVTATVTLPPVSSLTVLSYIGAAGPNGSDANTGERQPVATATNLNFTMLAAPTLLTPTEHSSGVTDSQSLTWSAFGGPTVYRVGFYDASGGSFNVVTASTSFALDKLTKAGMPLKGGTSYTWGVNVPGDGASSMDDEVAATPPVVGTSVFNSADSFTQTFTTQ